MKITTLLAGAGAAALFAGAANAAPETTVTPPVAPPAATAPPAASPASPAAPPAAVTAPAATPAPVVAKGDLVETLTASGQFKTLLKGLTATNLITVLKSHPSLTVLAPTDAAFAAMPPGKLDALMKNPAALQKLLAYHLINTTVDSSKIKGAKGPVMTVANANVELDGSGDTLKVNGATITQADVRTTGGGVIQVIDKVLDPNAGAAPAPAAPAPTTESAAPAAPATTPPPAPTEPPATPNPTPKG